MSADPLRVASPSGTGREYPPELVHGELCRTRFNINAPCDCGKESEPAPAERGPSGTGHNTAEAVCAECGRGLFACGNCGAARCFACNPSTGSHPRGSCSPDPPVAVPGPASVKEDFNAV